ncbi:MAG: heparinase II/III family protein [Balneolales bacterium]
MYTTFPVIPAMKAILTLILLTVFFSLAVAQDTSDRHPFLLVSEPDFEELQTRASRAPWSEMKKEAIDYITDEQNAYSRYLADEPGRRAALMSNIMSTGALAYILDPDNRSFYAGKIKENILYWDHLHAGRHHYSNQWEYQVPGGDALYNSILAYDLIYHDLTAEEREEITDKLDTAVEFIYTGWSSWGLNRFGVRGLWALFQGDTGHASLQEYMDRLYEFITVDGVFTPGPNYTHRITGTRHRDPKTSFMDILHRHELYDVYGDRRLQRGYEWIYGYSFSPTGRYYTFGDSSPNIFNATGLAGYRASKFSDKAGALASRILGDATPPARLLHYVLMTDLPPSPGLPSSSLFTDGGAWFMEDNVSEMSLGGALWNATLLGDYHQHKEVNAIQISAYGEDVIRNVGYNGWGNGALDFSWDYINQTAVSGNTILLDGENHQNRTGGGLLEGLTSPLFDYASGNSHEALANGVHHRNFVFVHPQDEKPGYFILFDEVQASRSAGEVNLVLHPNSSSVATAMEKTEYIWKVGPNYREDDVFVSVFLGTQPGRVTLEEGVLLGGHRTESGHIVGKYLYSTYDAGPAGARNIVSVIFPFDSGHRKAAMTRVSEDGLTGVTLDHGDGVMDYALESNGTSARTVSGTVQWQGRALSYREKDEHPSFYFVRKGTRFMNDQTGFTSDEPVSIHMKGKEGSVVSEGAAVSFRMSGLQRIMIDDREAEVIATGHGSMQVRIPPGSYQIKLITG